MKNVILTPNPYRDRNFATVRSAMQILKDAGLRVSLCLPFEVDRGYELPKDLRFSEHHRIEAGGNGEQVCNRLTAFVDVHIRREFDGLPVFGGGPRLQNQPRHVALAHGKDFNPVAG